MSWNRESTQGLYDYDNKNVTKSSLKLSTSGWIVRIGNQIRFFSEEPPAVQFTYLAEIKNIGGTVCLIPYTPADRSVPFEKLWLVAKFLKSEGNIRGYRLSEGDVIKVGRMKFRVKELNASAETGDAPFSLDNMVNADEEESENSEDESQSQFVLPCRVCLGQHYDDLNPLISPCHCGGTMKYIHLDCLQKYLKSKLTTRASETSLSFGWKRLECDLCKKPFPYKIAVKNKVVELVDIPKPPGKFVILEALCSDRESSKGIHLVSLYNKDSIRFGRSNECELKFSDISVSRLHAVIKFFNGNFYVEDTKSKFGTLIQIKRPIALEYYSSLIVQTGRTMLTINYRKQMSLFSACFRSQPNPFDHQSGLFPIGTGIPLSIAETQELIARAGLKPIRKEKYHQNRNILFEHNQLGVNSSYEDEEEVMDLEEVEVAVNLEDN